MKLETDKIGLDENFYSNMYLYDLFRYSWYFSTGTALSIWNLTFVMV